MSAANGVQMKYFWLTILLTSTAYAQNGNAPYQDRPTPADFASCKAVFTDLLTNPADVKEITRQCNLSYENRDILRDADGIRQCHLYLKQARIPGTNPLSDCRNYGFRSDISSPDFNNCILQARSSDLVNYQLKACQDFQIRRNIGSSTFKNCYTYIRNDDNSASPWDAAQACRDENDAKRIGNPDYISCQRDLRTMGYGFLDRMSFCVGYNRDLAGSVRSLKTCVTNFGTAFSDPKPFCKDNYQSPELYSSKTTACLNGMRTSVAPNFFSMMNGWEFKDFIRKVADECARSVRPPRPDAQVKFLSAFVLPTGSRYQNEEIAGLSAVSYDEKANAIYAGSDQRFQGKNYIFKMELDMTRGMRVNPVQLIKLSPQFLAEDLRRQNGRNRGMENFDIDLEGMVRDQSGNYIVSAESLHEGDKGFLKVFSPSGKQIDNIELPEKFYPQDADVVRQETHTEWVSENEARRRQCHGNDCQDDDNNDDDRGRYPNQLRQGVYNPTPVITRIPGPPDFGNNGNNGNNRNNNYHDSSRQVQVTVTRNVTHQERVSGIFDNRGFESLGLTPDGKTLFTANEAPLAQDRIDKQTIVRMILLEQKNRKVGFEAVAEHFYPLSYDKGFEAGLVDILPISRTEVLTLERSFDRSTSTIKSRIFHVDLQNAVDVSKIAKAVDVKDRLSTLLLKKELLLDLDDIIPELPLGLRRLDNLEGMTFGPLSPAGKRTLILVSDNNQNRQQMTQILWLELDK